MSNKCCRVHGLSIDPAPNNLPWVYISHDYKVERVNITFKVAKIAVAGWHLGAQIAFFGVPRQRVSTFSINIFDNKPKKLEPDMLDRGVIVDALHDGDVSFVQKQ